MRRRSSRCLNGAERCTVARHGSNLCASLVGAARIRAAIERPKTLGLSRRKIPTIVVVGSMTEPVTQDPHHASRRDPLPTPRSCEETGRSCTENPLASDELPRSSVSRALARPFRLLVLGPDSHVAVGHSVAALIAVVVLPARSGRTAPAARTRGHTCGAARIFTWRRRACRGVTRGRPSSARSAGGLRRCAGGRKDEHRCCYR